MSIAGSQQRTLLELLAQLRPHWRRDRNLPARIQNSLARQRAFGARDRRLYRELIYTTLRYLPWVEAELDRDADSAVQLIAWLAADSRVTERFRAAFASDWPVCPPSVREKKEIVTGRLSQATAFSRLAAEPATSLLPDWFHEHCPAAFASHEVDALLARAPLWIRIQTSDTAPIIAEFAQLGWRWTADDTLSSAWRLEDQVNVTKTRVFETGLIEVQDLGSQLLLESCGIAPGARWLDACAGAGGKTLQLAALLGPNGQIDASDIRTDALRELAVRATRAGIVVSHNASRTRDDEHRHLSGNAKAAHFAPLRILTTAADSVYDGVLVDAPCSGSGTWRRAPHLKWTTTPSHIEAAATKQRQLLAGFSDRVRTGGQLIYATCSLSRLENEDVVRAFLSTHADFAIERPRKSFRASQSEFGLIFLPSQHDTDGFFVSCLRRRA